MNDAIKTKQEKREQEHADILANFLRTFECAAGRAVLEHLHATAGTRCSSFHPGANGIDAIAAAKRDGGKTLVWFIEAKLEEARAAGRTETSGKPKTTGGRTARRKST